MDGIHEFSLGSFRCLVLFDNSKTARLSQVFPRIPEEKLAAAMLDLGLEDETVTVGYNCLFVNTGSQKILIDSGSGSGKLLENIYRAGIEPTDIDTIVITHGDGDHIGGVYDFPNAQLVMLGLGWKLWTSDEGRAQLVEEFVSLFRSKLSAEEEAAMARRRLVYGESVLPAAQSRVGMVEPEVEFVPGIRLLAAPGHRSDHSAVEIESDGEMLLHVVDGIRHPLQTANPNWASFIDSDPVETAATNRRLLARAAAKNALVFAAHLPYPGLGRVRGQDGRWIWDPAT
jgi:glyoxylase-like metal-dependent hydrolase (beta-lactamase superfamily II)